MSVPPNSASPSEHVPADACIALHQEYEQRYAQMLGELGQLYDAQMKLRVQIECLHAQLSRVENENWYMKSVVKYSASRLVDLGSRSRER
jgi:hypothetical protein